MNKSILVLDENSVIHGLVTSALEAEGLTLHHEFNPGRYLERATSLMPDLILVGNSAQDSELDVCRRLKDSSSLAEVPVVLMAGSKDAISRERLDHAGVAGVVRKPFEASDLQQQVSKHLDLVDLVGSAYEFRQSQRTTEEGMNPLANLDVVDDEVMGLLRGEAPPEPPEEEARITAGMTPVVDDEVLAEALQPERAFEVLEEESPEPAAPSMEPLETLGGDFPSEPLAVPEDEDQLEELGAADVLEEETAEEMVFEPQGIDEDLEAAPAIDEEETTLEDIEVELPEDAVDMGGLDRELGEGSVDLFESDLTAEEAAGGDGAGLEEAIPLSVRRMMELKPVFTMSQEESAADEVLEPFDFVAEEADVEAIQAGLDDLDTVEMEPEAEPEEVEEQELQFASEEELAAIEPEPAPEPVAEAQPEPAHAGAPGEELEPPEDFDLMGPGPAAPAEPAEELAAEPIEAASLDGLADEVTVAELESEELEAAEIGPEMVEELASPGFGEAAAEEPAPAPEAAPAPEPAEVAADEDDDLFVEEFLGDDEIDEEQIIAAEMEEEPEEQAELTAEDEAELEQLLSEEEHLADLESVDEEDLLAEEEALADEDIPIEAEEEEQILTRLESERLADEEVGAGEAPSGEEEPSMTAEPLFERNFNALEEEAAGGDETWRLDQDEGGFAIAEEPAPGDEAAEVISLESPLDEAIEEMPASALEEVVETGEPEATPMEEMEAAAAAEPPEEEPPVSIEFGEGDSAVFDGEAQEEEPWKPKAPPGFIPKPAEDFPEDAVREPFTGPQTEPEAEEPPVEPRHKPEEVLEVPEESLEPVAPLAAEAPEAPELTGEGLDLADQVAPHELEGEEEAPEVEDEFDHEPSLSALADDTLQTVTGAAEPAEEPAGLEGESLEASWLDESAEGEEAELTQDEKDALFGESLGEEALGEPELTEALGEETLGEEALGGSVLEEGPALAGGEDLESILGGGEAEGEEIAPLAAGAAAAGAVAAGAAVAESGGESPEFDNLFASLREEIAANPEGEHLDDVLRHERIRDHIAELDFSVPSHETTFSRALGLYAAPGEGAAASAYPAALQGSGAAPAAAPPPPAAPAAEVTPPPAAAPAAAGGLAGGIAQVSALSLLDDDVREKLGQVLDEIISISVRKAVQEEMPKIMERMSKDT